jgi:hypothetical protein
MAPFKKYTKDDRFYNDNNLIKSRVRPVAQRRKNYLLAGAHDAVDIKIS